MSDPTERGAPNARTLLSRARSALLEAPAWLDYVRSVYAIDPGDGYPFQSYVGINFTKTTIKNFKFYFSFSRRLSPEEIAVALPVADRGRFDDFYPRWAPSKVDDILHRGTTFAVKVDPKGKCTFYYHLRLKGLPLGPPERLTLSFLDRGAEHGVCEEFDGSAIHLKRYYYCRDEATIARSLETAGLCRGDEGSKIDLIEIIESDGRDKVAWVTSSPMIIQTLLKERGPSLLSAGLLELRHSSGLQLFGPGSARDGSDHSIYFVVRAHPLTQEGFACDGVRRFLASYLGLEEFRAGPFTRDDGSTSLQGVNWKA